MVLSIGSIELRDFEVPSAVRFGGTHRTAVHRLGDGRRVVDRLGPDETDISFSGTISGPDAGARARGLDRLRATGEPVTLRWDSFRFDVVIRQFAADFHSGQWISYQVSCTVLDQSAQDTTSDLSADRRALRWDAAALSGVSTLWAERLASRSAWQVAEVDGIPGQVPDEEVVRALNALVQDAESDLATAEAGLHSALVIPFPASVASPVRLMALAVIGRAYARRMVVSLSGG
jgi:hypothetical protein